MAEPKSAKPKAKPKASASRSETKARPKAAAKPKAAPAKAKGKSKSSPDIYTDPALRDRLKDEITAGDKGGKPGQWSARKAQLLAAEYEKAGGDYKNGKQKKTDEQKHLETSGPRKTGRPPTTNPPTVKGGRPATSPPRPGTS